jgi:hypothetical protein
MFWVVIGLLFLGIFGASVLIANALKPKGQPMSRHDDRAQSVWRAEVTASRTATNG